MFFLTDKICDNSGSKKQDDLMMTLLGAKRLSIHLDFALDINRTHDVYAIKRVCNKTK